MPFGVGDGGGHAVRGAGLPGGTALVVVAGLLQLLGFAIPVVISTTTDAGTAYEFQWSYETFRLQSPGLAELFFFLPVTGIVTLIAAFLPTRFLRPAILTAIGAASMVLLYRDPELRTRLLQRLPLFDWDADRASALKGIALLAMAIGGGILVSGAPKSVKVLAGLLAAAPALVYLGAPLPSEFPGGFAWKSRFAEVLGNRPSEVEAGWSVVTGYYILVGAVAIDLLAIGLGAVMGLVSLRSRWSGASRWVVRGVVLSLATAVLVIVGRAVKPLYDVTYEVSAFTSELTYNLKMLMATLGIVVLLPVGLIDLADRVFGSRY